MIVSAAARLSSPAGAVSGNPVVVGTGPGCSAATVKVYRSRSSRCPNTWAAMDRSNATTSGRASATTRCRESAVIQLLSHGSLGALRCDLRVAGPTAVFGGFCRRWGGPLIDGGTVRRPRLRRTGPATEDAPGESPGRRARSGVGSQAQTFHIEMILNLGARGRVSL